MNIKKIPEKNNFPTTETDILRSIRQVLEIYGFFCIRIQQGLGCHKGISDIIIIKDGHVTFVEIKKPKGKLSKHQERFSKDISSRGGDYVVFRDLDEAMEFIKNINKREAL